MKFNEKPIGGGRPPSRRPKFIRLIIIRARTRKGNGMYAVYETREYARDTSSHRLIYLSSISTSRLTIHGPEKIITLEK